MNNLTKYISIVLILLPRLYAGEEGDKTTDSILMAKKAEIYIKKLNGSVREIGADEKGKMGGDGFYLATFYVSNVSYTSIRKKLIEFIKQEYNVDKLQFRETKVDEESINKAITDEKPGDKGSLKKSLHRLRGYVIEKPPTIKDISSFSVVIFPLPESGNVRITIYAQSGVDP